MTGNELLTRTLLCVSGITLVSAAIAWLTARDTRMFLMLLGLGVSGLAIRWMLRRGEAAERAPVQRVTSTSLSQLAYLFLFGLGSLGAALGCFIWATHLTASDLPFRILLIVAGLGCLFLVYASFAAWWFARRLPRRD